MVCRGFHAPVPAWQCMLTDGRMQQVKNGALARDAWESCGEPGGEQAIQNIRMRGMAARRALAPSAMMPRTTAMRAGKTLGASAVR